MTLPALRQYREELVAQRNGARPAQGLDDAQFRSAVRALNDDDLELGPHRTDTAGRTLPPSLLPRRPGPALPHDALLHRPAPVGHHPPRRRAPHRVGAPAGARGQAPTRAKPVRGRRPRPDPARHDHARDLRRRDQSGELSTTAFPRHRGRREPRGGAVVISAGPGRPAAPRRSADAARRRRPRRRRSHSDAGRAGPHRCAPDRVRPRAPNRGHR